MWWRLVGVRGQRVEFVVRANRGENLNNWCREYEISRRPHLSPRRTAAGIEAPIVALRCQRPDWGARKRRLAHRRCQVLCI
jgi:hypothetical protein